MTELGSSKFFWPRWRHNGFIALALAALVAVMLSACQTSGYQTSGGKDIGKPECKMVSGAASKLHISPLQAAIGRAPATVEYCRYGDRTSEFAKWKNGSYLIYAISHGGFFTVSPDHLVRQLNKHLAIDISRSGVKHIQGRHNSLYYYAHSLGANTNRHTCLYFSTFPNTWSETGPDGFTMGYFNGRYCFAGSLAKPGNVAVIKALGHK